MEARHGPRARSPFDVDEHEASGAASPHARSPFDQEPNPFDEQSDAALGHAEVEESTFVYQPPPAGAHILHALCVLI